MTLHYDAFQVMVFVLTYLVIYNLTSFIFFTTFLQFANTQVVSLLSLSTLNQSNFFTKALSLTLLSLAGVPPLLGFFSKVFIVIIVSNSQFFVLFPPFFVLLFAGLYFYIQNIRFLHSTKPHNLAHLTELTFRISILYVYTTFTLGFFIIFGLFFIDDFLMIFSWLLV